MPEWEDDALAELAKRPLTKEEYQAASQMSWDALTGVPFKYLDHVPFARMEGTQLISPPKPSPYANIIVQQLGTPNTAIMQLAHKMDFFNLWLLEQQGVFKGEFDVIIRHKKPGGIKRVFAAVLPHFEYSVYYEGYFDDVTQSEMEVLLEDEPYIYLYDQDRRGLEDWIMDFRPPI